MQEYSRVVTKLDLSSKKQRSHYVPILLFIIILLGTFLRFHNLGAEPIWVDEAFTYHYTTLSWSELIDILEERDVHPFLFYVFENTFTSLAGTSEFALRFLPFLFGSLSILLLFLVVKEIYNPRIALLTTLFFSLSYTFILYSQEAKMYTQLIFFMLFSFLFFFKYLKSPSTKNIIFLTISNILLLYTHVLSFVIIAAQLIIYYGTALLSYWHKIDVINTFFPAIKTKHNPLEFTYSYLILALAYLPWISIAYSQFHFLITFVLREKFALKFGFDGFYPSSVAVIIGGIILLSILLLIVSKKQTVQKLLTVLKKIKLPTTIFILFYLAFLFTNLIIYKDFFGNVTLVRYLLIFVPLIYIFFAYYLSKINSKKLFTFLIIIYLIASTIILVNYHTTDRKEQWQEAAAFIKEDAQPNDILIFHAAGHTWWAFNYYFKQDPNNLEQLRLNYADDFPLIEPAVASKDHAYLILSHNFRTKDFFKDEMNKKYELVDNIELIAIKIYKYKIN